MTGLLSNSIGPYGQKINQRKIVNVFIFISFKTFVLSALKPSH